MENYYILLPDHTIQRVGMRVWAAWFEKADRRVKQTTTEATVISTVFLGLDHSFGASGPPLLFETMVFERQEEWVSIDHDRYATWDEALAGHNRMVRNIRGQEKAAKEMLAAL